MNTKLFAGLEDFVDEVTGDAEVDDTITSEDVTTAVDKAIEITEIAQATQDIADNTEMLFDHYDELQNQLAYVRENGVDRAFLTLTNYNNTLSNGLGIVLPSCESFSTSGTPNSPESQAVIAGLEGILSSIGDFIKKIWDAIVNMCKKILGWFSGGNSSEHDKKEANDQRRADSKKKLKSDEELNDILFVGFTDPRYVTGDVADAVNEFEKFVNTLKAELDRALAAARNGENGEHLFRDFSEDMRAACNVMATTASKRPETDEFTALEASRDIDIWRNGQQVIIHMKEVFERYYSIMREFAEKKKTDIGNKNERELLTLIVKLNTEMTTRLKTVHKVLWNEYNCDFRRLRQDIYA